MTWPFLPPDHPAKQKFLGGPVLLFFLGHVTSATAQKCFCCPLQVQSGVGRTGKWWGHEHFAECSPDMLLFAKGIASGFPMAGVAATGEIYENMTAGMLVSIISASA